VELGQIGARLVDLVREARQGTEIVITEGGEPVARLVGVAGSTPERRPGSARGMFTVPDDLDAPLDDFRDYM
jgi:prevent-host-death family protein